MDPPTRAEPAQPRASITCLTGPLAGAVIPIPEDGLLLGRSPQGDVVLADPGVSRRHCRLEPDGDLHVLIDLGSRHGTRVNRARVERCRLNDGDRFAVGRSAFSYQAACDARSGDPTVSMEIHDLDEWFEAPERLSVAEGAERSERLLAGEDSARLAALSRVGEALSSLSEPIPLAERLLELLFEVVPASRGGIVLFADLCLPTEGAPRYDLVVAMGRDTQGDDRVRLSRTVIDGVAVRREGVVANGVLDAAEWAGSQSLGEGRVRSVLCVPLTLFERVIGVLYLDSSAPEARFTGEHLELATAFAGLAALPLLAAHREAARGLLEGPPLAPAPPVPTSPATLADAPPVLVAFRPQAPLHLGSALRVLAALRLAGDKQARVLLVDHAVAGATAAGLDRLALLDERLVARAARTSSVPSIARLAAHVASAIGVGERADLGDGREWFREVLLAATLVTAGARHVILETEGETEAGLLMPDRGAEIAVARRLAARLEKASGIRLTPCFPVASGLPPFLGLDGEGPMGASVRGTVQVMDPPDVVAKKIRTAKTDTRPVLDPNVDLSLEVRNLLLLLHALSGEPVEALLGRFEGRGYGELKEELCEATLTFLRPIQARRAALEADEHLAASMEREAALVEAAGRRLALVLSEGR